MKTLPSCLDIQPACCAHARLKAPCRRALASRCAETRPRTPPAAASLPRRWGRSAWKVAARQGQEG